MMDTLRLYPTLCGWLLEDGHDALTEFPTYAAALAAALTWRKDHGAGVIVVYSDVGACSQLDWERVTADAAPFGDGEHPAGL